MIFLTKNSTRSSISRNENENKNENIEKNNDENVGGRNSLTNIINEYYDNNENGNDLDENIQDNKMTMESFDSPKKNNDIYNDNENDENNFSENNNYINLLEEKTINSEKMNLNNEEILKLLNDENQNYNDYEKSQKNNNFIRSKNQGITNTKVRNNYKNKEDNKLNKKNKGNIIRKDEKEDINVRRNKIFEKIPLHSNYIEYKEYEKYILDNNHEELLNNGNEEDIFGKFVDNIIEKSYHVYTNRQCQSCANLLTNGKSCVKCPKYHHLIKCGNNKKIKNNK